MDQQHKMMKILYLGGRVLRVMALLILKQDICPDNFFVFTYIQLQQTGNNRSHQVDASMSGMRVVQNIKSNSVKRKHACIYDIERSND